MAAPAHFLVIGRKLINRRADGVLVLTIRPVVYEDGLLFALSPRDFPFAVVCVIVGI